MLFAEFAGDARGVRRVEAVDGVVGEPVDLRAVAGHDRAGLAERREHLRAGGDAVGVDEDEAVRIANDSVYGLAAFVFTKDQTLGWRIAEELEAGSVWVNDIQRSSQLAPFGGIKQSGMGRELGPEGLHAFQVYKTI